MEYIRPECLPAPRFFRRLDPRVGLLKIIPGTDCGLLDYLLAHNDAVIIESYGVGGLPSYQGSGFFRRDPPRDRGRQDRRHDHAGAERGQQSRRL